MCRDSSPQERTDIFLRRRAVTHSSFPATSSSSLPLPLFVPLHLRPPSLESFVCVILLFFATKFSHRGCGDFAPVWREKPASIGQFQPIEPPLSPARPAPPLDICHTIKTTQALWAQTFRQKKRTFSSFSTPLRRSLVRRLAPDICHPAVAERSCCQSASHLLPVTVA